MSIKAKTGFFLTGTGAASSTLSIAGVGFTPKAIIFWGSGRTATGTGRQDIHNSIGFACTGISNSGIAASSTDAAATTSTDNYSDSTTSIFRLNSNGVNGGKAHVTTLGVDGFTITIDTQFTNSTYINYLCLGGDDITGVKVGNFTLPATATTKAITGIGFKPDILFFLGCGETGLGDKTDFQQAFGVAIRNGLVQGAITCAAMDNQVTTIAKNYQRDGEAIATISGLGVLNNRASVQSFDNDGFTISASEVNTNQNTLIYLAIKGGRYQLENNTLPDNTITPKTISGYAFLARAIFIFATELAKSTLDTVGNNASMSIGAVDTLGNQVVSQFSNYNGLADDASVASELTSSVLVNSNSGGGQDVVSSLSSHGPNGFNILNSVYTLGTSDYFFFYLLIGDEINSGIQLDL
jgi:hypothetical protein